MLQGEPANDDFEHQEYFIPNDIFESENESLDGNEGFEKPTNLKEMFDSPTYNTPINMPVIITRLQLFFMVLKFGVSNKLPISAMSNLIVMINSMFANHIVPHSRYMLDKFFNNSEGIYFHVTCPKCENYVGRLEQLSPDTQCAVCRTNIGIPNESCSNLFALIDPSRSISELLTENSNYYDDLMKNRSKRDSNYIKDIYDGEMYREFVSSLAPQDKQNYVTATFNSDGAQPFKSSPLSLWPIYLMINELPPQERFKHVIPCALWFNNNKPKMTVFLDAFTEMVNEFSSEGIECFINGEKRRIKLFSLLCCVDSLARAIMQGLTQFNGKFGCNWCLHPTVWFGATKYPILDYAVRLREVNATINLMKKTTGKKPFIQGIKEVCALMNLKFFNIIFGFVPDYMHFLVAGVCKQISNYLMKPAEINFYQKLIKNIKFPYQVSRLTKPISRNKYWKAREWNFYHKTSKRIA